MIPKEIMQKAINTYGYNAQCDVAIEEMSELTKEILKYRRALAEQPPEWDGEVATSELAEEIADVEIMLEQLKMIFDCHNRVEIHKTYKLNRLRNRLEDTK